MLALIHCFPDSPQRGTFASPIVKMTYRQFQKKKIFKLQNFFYVKVFFGLVKFIFPYDY